MNLLNIITDELEQNLKNETLSTENISLIEQLFKKIKEFSSYVDRICVKTEKMYYDLDSKIHFLTQNEIIDGKCCTMKSSSSNAQNKTNTEVKIENWRTLKPNSGPNVFTLNKYRYYDRSHRLMKQNNE